MSNVTERKAKFAHRMRWVLFLGFALVILLLGYVVVELKQLSDEVHQEGQKIELRRADVEHTRVAIEKKGK